MIVLTENTRQRLNTRIAKSVIEDIIEDYEAIKKDIENRVLNELDKKEKAEVLKEEYKKYINELQSFSNWQEYKMDEQMIDFENNEHRINEDYLNNLISEITRGYLLGSANERYLECSQRLSSLFEKEVLCFKMYNLLLDIVRNEQNDYPKAEKPVNPYLTIWNEIIVEQESHIKKWDKIFYRNNKSPEKGKILFFNYFDFHERIESVQSDIEEIITKISNPDTDPLVEYLNDLEDIVSELQHYQIVLLEQYFYPLTKDKIRMMCLVYIYDFIIYKADLINKDINPTFASSSSLSPNSKWPALEKYSNALSATNPPSKTYHSFEIAIEKHVQYEKTKKHLLSLEIEQSLKDMMNTLIEYKCIDEKTSARHFVKLFSGVKIENKVKWIGTRKDFRFFIERMYNEKLKSVKGDEYWQVASFCFDIGGVLTPQEFSEKARKADKTEEKEGVINPIRRSINHLRDIN